MDTKSAERLFQDLRLQASAPDELYDRQWAEAILRRALRALREKFAARRRAETLRQLEVFLGPDGDAPSYAKVAAKLGQSENAIAAAVYRLRAEFRELLRQEVAETIADGEDVDEELRYLLRAVG